MMPRSTSLSSGREGMFYEKLPNGMVHCFLCAHQCKIADTKFGVCRVRQNVGGQLYTMVYGKVVSANVDPIEKKPLYHFMPGSTSYSFATIGCNFQCGFCQNWQISQFPRDVGGVVPKQEVPPESIVQEAQTHNCQSISYTYTEPTIFFEYAYDVAKRATPAGLGNVFVTNGYMTREALDVIAPYLDAANVDLKSFRDPYYKTICKARLQPVLDSIRRLRELGIWTEITTLVIPGENDSAEELGQIARFIAEVDRDMPWHVSRFHPTYEFPDHPVTPVETLRLARDIGRENGVRYIYLGNVPEGLDTLCYHCGETVVKRWYMSVREMKVKDGKCPKCGAAIAGVWSAKDSRTK